EQTAVQAGISGISYAVANLNELRLSENMYDVVFASSSVHHIANLESLFANVGKCLKPRGLFILLEYVGPSQFQLTDKATGIINHLLLKDIVQNFEAGSPERASILNLLLYLEMLLVKEKVITSDFCLVVATPSPGR